MIKWQVIAAAIAVLLIGLVAIDAVRNGGEDVRVLAYEKGTYLGRPDTALDEETIARIRDRGRNQAVGW